MRLSLVAMDTLDEFAALMYNPFWWKWRLDTIPIVRMDLEWMLRDRAYGCPVAL